MILSDDDHHHHIDEEEEEEEDIAVVIDGDEDGDDDYDFFLPSVSVWQAEKQCHEQVEASCKVDRNRGPHRAGITSHMVRLLAPQVRNPATQN
jgi:hypothetical protein